jgi:excisionase family DNA binding protein
MPSQPEGLLTTVEVASLLRVHPKQIYRLLRKGLPAQRLGSEWRFSGSDVLAWTKGGKAVEAVGAPSAELQLRQEVERPALLAANGDLAVELLLRCLRDEGCLLGFVQADRGKALELLAKGAVLLAGCHGDGPPARLGEERMARLHLVTREIGLAVRGGQAVPPLEALGKSRLASRAPSAGVRSLLDAALSKAGLDPVKVHRKAALFPSHLDVACAVARGDCDVGLLSRAWAARLGLTFKRLALEPYGLLLRARDLGAPLVVRTCEAAQSPAYRKAVAEIPGYDAAGAGDIRYDAG